jgi:hypothetical protein
MNTRKGGREMLAITPAMVDAGVDTALSWISEYETGGVGLSELVRLIVRASLDQLTRCICPVCGVDVTADFAVRLGEKIRDNDRRFRAGDLSVRAPSTVNREEAG